MKKILLLLAMLVFIGKVSAQHLYIQNNTCTDMNVVLYADDGTCFSSGPLDQTNTITVPGGSMNDIELDFSDPDPYNYSIVTGIPPGPLWVNGSGLPTNGTFEFVKADFWTVCVTTPSGTCGAYPADGGNLFICSPGFSSNMIFGNSMNCAGNTCYINCNASCDPPGTCPATFINVDFYKNSFGWWLVFN